MKTFMITFAALGLMSAAALASAEHCVTRTVSTNYNDGLNGAVSKVCYVGDNDRQAKDCKAE